MRLLLPIIMALTFTLSGCIKSPLESAVDIDVANSIHIDPISATNEDGDVTTTNEDGDVTANNEDGDVATINEDGDVAVTNEDGDVDATNEDGEVTANNEDGDVDATNEDGDVSTDSGAVNEDGDILVVNDDTVPPAVDPVDTMPAPDVAGLSPREYGAWADVPLPEDHAEEEYEPEVVPPVVVDAGGDPTFATVWADYDILHGLPAPSNPLPDIATVLSGTVSWTATATGTLNPRAEHLSEPQFKLTWDATKPTALRGDLSFLTTIDDAEKRVTLALYSARLSGLVFKPTYANDPDWDGKGFAGSFGDNTFTGLTGRVKAPYFVGEFAATASD